MMDPNIGRFTSYDDFEGDPSEPLHLHKYAYAGGDPVNNTDPDGHDFISEFIQVAGVTNTLAQVSSRPTTGPATTRATKFSGTILNVTITPVYLVPKGKNGVPLVPQFVKQLNDVHDYWLDNAGINLRWGNVTTDNTGKWRNIEFGYYSGNTTDAIRAFYLSNGSHPVVLYGAIITDKPLFHDAKSTIGYTPPGLNAGLNEGVIVSFVGAETIAHELGHLFLQTPDHDANPWNLMAEGEARDALKGHTLSQLTLTAEQAAKARDVVQTCGWVGP